MNGTKKMTNIARVITAKWCEKVGFGKAPLNKHSQCDIYSGARFVPERAWHKTITFINAPAVGVKCHYLMSTWKRKALLMFLVIPSGIAWLWLCLIGSLVFVHGMFRDVPSFLMSLMAVTGLACISIALWSVFRYPKISKVSIWAYGIGCFALVAGGFTGFATSYLYYLSVLCLGSAGLLVIHEYRRST